MPDLISCPKCNRNNGVRRTTCLYCGAELPVTEETLDVQVPTFKPVEDWEQGRTVVLLPFGASEPTRHQIDRLSEIGRVEEDVARAILASGCPLPICRVAAAGEAELVRRLLGAAGLETTVVVDDALDVDSPSKRIREIRLGPQTLDVLVLFGGWESVALADVVRIVEGRVVSTRVELVEGAGRTKKADAVNTSHSFIETRLVDIYGPTLESSYRIRADSFNFACLGGRPSFRLDDNVVALGQLLREYVGEDRFDARFSTVSKLLDHAWPQESQVRSYGLSPRGDFKKYTRSAVTTDALTQFTRFSRMAYILAQEAGRSDARQ